MKWDVSNQDSMVVAFDTVHFLLDYRLQVVPAESKPKEIFCWQLRYGNLMQHCLTDKPV